MLQIASPPAGSLLARMADGREARMFLQNFPPDQQSLAGTFICEKVIRPKAG